MLYELKLSHLARSLLDPVLTVVGKVALKTATNDPDNDNTIELKVLFECPFKAGTVPKVFTSVSGRAWHKSLLGISSIYDVNNLGFTIYLKREGSTAEQILKLADTHQWILNYRAFA